MAKLVDVLRDDDPVELLSKQMPLNIDDDLTVSVEGPNRRFLAPDISLRNDARRIFNLINEEY